MGTAIFLNEAKKGAKNLSRVGWYEQASDV